MNYIPGFMAIKKSIHVKGDEIPVYSDAHRLLILISNLISNAIKYSDPLKEEQYIDIRATITHDQVTLQVNDNGIGIHPDYLPNIYNMFYRATEGSEGAGLGLYIVREIVDKLDGRINICSTVKEETVVRVDIPNQKC